MTGMLSRCRIGRSQPGQCDGGLMTDSPRGTRQITTLRKDPIISPKSPHSTARRGVTSRQRSGTSLAAGPR